MVIPLDLGSSVFPQFLPSFRPWLRWLGVLGICTLLALPGARLCAQPASAETPLQDIERAAEAFERGAPLPPWADLMPLPAPATPAADAAVVVRLAETQLHLGPPQTALVSRAIQVHQAHALAEIGHLKINFHPQYQRLRLHSLQILRGDAVIDHTWSAPVRFLQREGGLEHGVYSGTITASMLLPDVRVGDTMQVVLSVEGANPVLGGRFTIDAHWDLPIPIAVRRVTLLAPEGRPVRWRWVGGAEDAGPTPVEARAGGVRRLRFEAHDIPGVQFESYMPPEAQPLRWLQFSEYADWGEVARWAVDLFPSDAPLPDALAPLMDRLRALDDPDERVLQALQWVQSEIRYWSVSLGESSYRPQLPAEVLRRRYGDCKDKALLLVRILSELGIDARPVLASMRTRKGPALLLPTPEAFDHVIVQVRLHGRDFYLDATREAQVGQLARLGQPFEDAVVLPVAAETTGLVTLRSPNRAEIFSNDLTERFSLDRLGADGYLEMEIRWTGALAENTRGLLQRLDAEHLRQFVLASYEDQYPGIRLAEPPQVRDDRQLNRLVLWARFVVPELATEVGSHWVVRYVPHLKGSFLLPGHERRRFPLVVPGYPLLKTYRVEMAWPPGVVADVKPDSRALETPHFLLQTTRSVHEGVDRRTVHFAPKVGSVPAAELPRLRSDLVKLDEQIGGLIVVAKQAAIADGEPRAPLDRMRRDLEVQIERAGRLLDQGDLAGEDLATVLCSRATASIQLGLPSEDPPGVQAEPFAAALADAQWAVRVAPRSGYAWQCLGSVQFARGQFAQADAAFTRALPLVEVTATLYLRRGQARFYDGRLDDAAHDFGLAVAGQVDPVARLYAQLWQGWTLRRLDRPLPAELLAEAAREPHGRWPRPALAMLAGLLNAEEMLAPLQTDTGDQRLFHLVEGWFNLGQQRRWQGHTAQAEDAFERARALGVTMYLEHVAAGFELQQLQAAR